MQSLNQLNYTPASLADKISGGKWINAPHLSLLDSLLFKTCITPNSKLIVNMPPRHGKSELISKYLPFWFLGAFPDKRIILTSYEATFAASWGAKVRDLIKEFGEDLFSIKLREDNYAAGRFSLKSGGSLTCVGAGGPLTGKGADLLIIDDPVKNDAEANSSTYRDKIWEWFNSTAFTRLEPGASLILVMTRWHEDDLAGRLIKENPPGLQTIILPAIAQEDATDRLPGQALWPERFDVQALLNIKKLIGEYWFSALYQQNPTPSGGGVFKREYFQYYKEIKDFIVLPGGEKYLAADCPCGACVDLAAKTGEKNDYTVVLIFRITPKREILIKEIIRGRYGAADHLNLLKNLNEVNKFRIIGIESVQYQIALVQLAAREGLPVKELRPDKDKFSRALPMAAMLESGRVYFNKNMSGLYDFESELIGFPNAKYDDQADAFAYVYDLIELGNRVTPFGAKIKRI